MARTEEREFELVLGNKQLLSLFFLVVVLLAVFFSLGYMVGKSIGPAQTLAAEPPAAAPADRPAPVARPPATTPAPEADAAPPGLPVERTEPAAVREVAPEPAAPPAPAAGNPAPPVPGPAVVMRGLHLQVAAVRVRPDAQALAESIRKKGYDVVLNDQAPDGWFRVLVGPFPDERAAREMRDRLEKDGYKSILRRP